MVNYESRDSEGRRAGKRNKDKEGSPLYTLGDNFSSSLLYKAVMPESAHSFTASFIERERKTRVWEKVVRVCKWLTARPNRSHS